MSSKRQQISVPINFGIARIFGVRSRPSASETGGGDQDISLRPRGMRRPKERAALAPSATTRPKPSSRRPSPCRQLSYFPQSSRCWTTAADAKACLARLVRPIALAVLMLITS